MEEKNAKNTKSSLTAEEIKDIAPNWTEGWTEEKLQEIASDYTAEEIMDIESRLPKLRRLEKIEDILNFVLFEVIVIQEIYIILSGKINSSNQLALILLGIGALLACLGFKMQVDNPQTEKRIKGQKIIFVGEIIDYIGMLLMVL